MKTTILVVLLSSMALAQSGNSIGFDIANGTCHTPTVGQDWLCGSSSGFLQAINGQAYAALTGSPGPAGPAGPSGASASVTVGLTVTGLPGTAASVTNTGTAQNAVLTFTIPQGKDGAPGTMPVNFTCSGVLFDATGAHFSGCH